MDSDDDGTAHLTGRRARSWERRSLCELWVVETEPTGRGKAAGETSPLGRQGGLSLPTLQVPASISSLPPEMKESTSASWSYRNGSSRDNEDNVLSPTTVLYRKRDQKHENLYNHQVQIHSHMCGTWVGTFRKPGFSKYIWPGIRNQHDGISPMGDVKPAALIWLWWIR